MISLRSTCLALFLSFGLGFPLDFADAAVFTRVEKNYYDISGSSGRELKEAMHARGPHGYWAYTQWHVSWSSHCNIKLKITYTYPRWVDRDEAPAYLVRSWNRMMANLVAHEEGHGDHGIQAAKEISENDCRNAKGITRNWAAEDKRYDKRTNHGAREGVRLSN